MACDFIFGVGSTPDLGDSTRTIAAVGQGGAGLPERDYYFDDDEKSKSIREAYRTHIARMFVLLGDSAEKAEAKARTVIEIETRLAEASLTNAELRQPANSYHMMSKAERAKLTPNVDWPRYFKSVGLDGIDAVNVAHPKFFTRVGEMVASVPLDDWKAYLRWRLVSSFASSSAGVNAPSSSDAVPNANRWQTNNASLVLCRQRTG